MSRVVANQSTLTNGDALKSGVDERVKSRLVPRVNRYFHLLPSDDQKVLFASLTKDANRPKRRASRTSMSSFVVRLRTRIMQFWPLLSTDDQQQLLTTWHSLVQQHLSNTVSAKITHLRHGKRVHASPVAGRTSLLSPPNQLWHLKALLGDEPVDEALAKGGGELSDDLIVSMLIKSQIPFYTNADQTHLILGTNELVERDFGPLKKIDPSVTLTRFGLAKMEEANERGYARL